MNATNGVDQAIDIRPPAAPPPYITVGQKAVNVRMAPYRATGDGSTSDFQQAQQAINDGGVGAEIHFPPGVYYFAGNQLVGQTFQKWVGHFQFGAGASPFTPGDGKVQLVWGPTLGATDAVVAGVNQVFEELTLQGVDLATTTGSAIRAGDAAHSNHSRYHRMSVVGFGRGITSTNGFYVEFNNVEFNRCGIGAYCDTAFNVSFLDCYFRADPVLLGVAAEFINNVKNARFIGGSIESFGPSGGIILASISSHLVMVGTYFESPSANNGGFGIDNRANANTIELLGCSVYVENLNRWVNCSGLDQTTLIAKGNRFQGANSATNPVLYYLPTNATGGLVQLGPDDVVDALFGIPGLLYVSAIPVPCPWLEIDMPREFGTTVSRVKGIGRPLWLPAQNAAPVVPGSTVAMADGVTWNPAGRIGGNPYPVWWDSTSWRPTFDATQIGTDRGDASVTLTVGTDAQVQRFATAFTANRTVTLATTGARNGDHFRVVRTNTAAFTLDVGGLKTIPAGTAAFVDVVYDSNGGVWRLAAYGTL